MGWLFVPFIWLVSWLEGAPTRTSIQFCIVFLIIHYVIRIMANVFMDRDLEDARVWNSRKHFGRPSFSLVSTKNGLVMKSGEDLDHATRCQNSLRDWYQIERRLKWNNWIYMAWIILLAITLDRL
jgi:hypothetical protein